MTKADFEESLNAVLIEHLDESITAAELAALQADVIARVELDWDPFESEDPLDLGSSEGSHSEDAFDLNQDEDD